MSGAEFKLAVSQAEINVRVGWKPGFVVLRMEDGLPGFERVVEVEMTPGQTDHLIGLLSDAINDKENE